MRYMAQVIRDLHGQWLPHEAQAKILHEVFFNGKKTVGVECGRKFGKTDIVSYILWRASCLLHSTDNYYIAPLKDQANEILWAPRRLQDFGPSKYLQSENQSQKRLTFNTKSFVKLDGSDRYEKYRGVEPDVLVYDEYKDFHPEFHPAMSPNLGAKAKKGMGIWIVIGTPPETDSHPKDPKRRHPFYEAMDEIAADPKGAYFNFSSYDNPHISHDWIDDQKAKYIARGDQAGFEREFMARRVKGGPGAIFPMWNDTLAWEHDQVMYHVRRDMKHLDRWVIADPGTATTFGVLFGMTNPYTKQVWILDEIYATKQDETSTRVIIPQLREKRRELAGELYWTQVYDEAASWFANEAGASYGEPFIPTHKALSRKTFGLNLIKDQMLESKLIISNRCKNLIWEIENYVKDKNGNIPKVNDHLIDCISGESLVETSLGKVRMDCLRNGMYVLTRNGYKRVTDHWLAGKRPVVRLTFSNGEKLVCTKDHLISTVKNSWCEAGKLQIGTEINCLSSMSFSKGLNSEGIRIRSEGMTAFTSNAVRCFMQKAYDTFTSRFGSMLTEMCQKATTSITSMITRLTTTSGIYKPCVERSICPSTTPAIVQKQNAKTWMQLEILPRLGILQRKERNGILKTPKECGETKNLLQRIASFAEKSLRRKQDTGYIATKTAKCQQGAGVWVSGLEVLKNEVEVYDATVEDEHEFFANGVLVHNCMRYMNGAAGFCFEEEEPPEAEEEDPRRGFTPEDDMETQRAMDPDYLIDNW
jgi:hypothetical protein